MLNVKIGINKVSSTLTERVTLDVPYYLLKLVSTNNNSIKILSVLDSAPFSRVNKLTLELVTALVDEDLPNGKVYLKAGTYKYEFYQSATTSLIITDNKLLESGLLLFDVDLPSTNYNNTNTEIVYGS